MPTAAPLQQLQAQQQSVALHAMTTAVSWTSNSAAGTAASTAWMNHQKMLLAIKPAAATAQQQVVPLQQAYVLAYAQSQQQQQQQMLWRQALTNSKPGSIVPTRGPNGNGGATRDAMATPFPTAVVLQGTVGPPTAAVLQGTVGGTPAPVLQGTVGGTPAPVLQGSVGGTPAAAATAAVANKEAVSLPSRAMAAAIDPAAAQPRMGCCKQLTFPGMAADGSGSSENCQDVCVEVATMKRKDSFVPRQPPQESLLLAGGQATGNANVAVAGGAAGIAEACEDALQCTGNGGGDAGSVAVVQGGKGGLVGNSGEGADVKDIWVCTYGFVECGGVVAAGDQCNCAEKILDEFKYGVYGDDWDVKIGNVGELLEWANAECGSSSISATAPATAVAASKDFGGLPDVMEQGSGLCLNHQGAAGHHGQQQQEEQDEQEPQDEEQQQQEEDEEGSQNNNMDVDDAASSEIDMNAIDSNGDAASGAAAAIDMNGGAAPAASAECDVGGATAAASTAEWAARFHMCG